MVPYLTELLEKIKNKLFSDESYFSKLNFENIQPSQLMPKTFN